MQHSNYPDDIRRYDNDPRSPFYVDQEVICNDCKGDRQDENGYCMDCGSQDISDIDATPYCNGCGATQRKDCECGPRAEND